MDQPTQPASTQTTARKATWRIGGRERMRLQWLAVAIISLLLFFFVILPYLLSMIQTRDYQTCQTNVLKIARGITTYSTDYDDTLPPAASWMINVEGAIAPTSGTGFAIEHYFKCPQDKSGAQCSYAYNDLLSGFSPNVRSEEPAEKQRWE